MSKQSVNDLSIEDLQSFIGEKCDDPCPDCGSYTIIDAHMTRWCSKCPWSTDQDITNFSISIGVKEANHDSNPMD